MDLVTCAWHRFDFMAGLEPARLNQVGDFKSSDSQVIWLASVCYNPYAIPGVLCGSLREFALSVAGGKVASHRRTSAVPVDKFAHSP